MEACAGYLFSMNLPPAAMTTPHMPTSKAIASGRTTTHGRRPQHQQGGDEARKRLPDSQRDVAAQRQFGLHPGRAEAVPTRELPDVLGQQRSRQLQSGAHDRE